MKKISFKTNAAFASVGNYRRQTKQIKTTIIPKCLNIEKSSKLVRYAIDAVTGIAAVYGLADQNVFTQAIGVVSAVSMSDMVTRVGMTTVEL